MPTKAEESVAFLELPETKSKAVNGEKRLNLILSSAVYDDLNTLSKVRRTSMTEIVRLALGLIKVAIHEISLGNKLVVANANGEIIKELILPGY